MPDQQQSVVPSEQIRWGWIIGAALVLGGTWFAWRLVKNGR